MIDIIFSLIFLILKYACELPSKLMTHFIRWMHWVYEIWVSRILSHPWYKYLIHFCGISSPMLIFSYPDTDIEFRGFENTQSTTSEKSITWSFEDEILEKLSLLYLLFHISEPYDLFFIGRKMRWYVEIFICLAVLFLKLMDTDSSIEWEWNKNTSRRFDKRGRKIEMGIFEERHLPYSTSSKFRFIFCISAPLWTSHNANSMTPWVSSLIHRAKICVRISLSLSIAGLNIVSSARVSTPNFLTDILHTIESWASCAASTSPISLETSNWFHRTSCTAPARASHDVWYILSRYSVPPSLVSADIKIKVRNSDDYI